MRPDIICGLDIGTSSIRTLIAQYVQSEEKILGLSDSVTKGFSKGVVLNLDQLSDAIEDAVTKAETQSQCRVKKVITNISGAHIRTFKSRGSIHISDRPSEITRDDIKRCIESARLIAMSLDREVIHLILERFYIDDKIEINEPLGLFGSRLDVELNIITSLVSILQNITKAVNVAGYEVEDIVTAGAATGLAIFDQKELQEGSVVVDVGKDLTEATLFMDGRLRDCFYFPFGSDDLTQVFQDRLMIMFEEAEELLVRHGIVGRFNQGLDETPILIPYLKDKAGPGYRNAQSDRKRSGGSWVDSNDTGVGACSFEEGHKDRLISKREISNLLFPKTEEIVQEVYKKIEPFLKKSKRAPHISVVGGISKMDGFIEVVEDVFGVPVDMGRIKNAKDFTVASFACSLGLVRYGAYKRLENKKRDISSADSLAGRLISKIQSLWSEYF